MFHLGLHQDALHGRLGLYGAQSTGMSHAVGAYYGAMSNVLRGMERGVSNDALVRSSTGHAIWNLTARTIANSFELKSYY